MSEDTTLPTSFVGRTESFYVLRSEGLSNPAIGKKYAVYSSVAAYNQRSEIPYYIPTKDALADFSHAVQICPKSLTTTWATDRDESDLGVTPARNLWLNRFQKAKEANTHAA